ncbi:MAG: branched-chain amino acid aminotransferase [Clostridia bacterium]|nr:branched-chain amino acid aminotransferase [Clostridia bacterium]MBQ5601867.1 branched-chain amino acid aminotransferase [Clostridia bacterium]
MLNIRYEYTTQKKVKPDYANLGFGKYFTDHMFMMDYTEGEGWHDARIVPFQNLSLSPATAVFHYAQEMFEGLKAYKTADGKIQLFRPQKNIERLNNTNRRMCIPEIDPDDVLQAIKAVVKTDEDWIPEEEGKSLYIRPFIIATDPMLGVHPSHSYLFCIILSPVGAYYATGINPVKIYVEPEYVRAVKGGTGFAKVGGNYAASLKGQEVAEKLGYAQVLWLDGIHHKYVDEVGAMNVFFVIDGEIVTPTLENGNILPGVTRDSAIQLLRSWGYKVSERLLSIDEIREAADNGKLDEAFGTGTAAVISPIGELNEAGKVMIINEGKIGPISQRLYNNLTGIQWGTVEDTMGWTVLVD